MDDQLTTRLQGELRDLREELDRMKAELARARPSSSDSMRAQSTCPKCGGRSLLCLERVRDAASGPGYTTMAVEEVVTGLFSMRTTGIFQVYVCRSCEYAEWYVGGAADIDPADLSKELRKHVRIIEGEPPEGGPFR